MDKEDPKEKIKHLMRESAAGPSKVVDFASAARSRGRPISPSGKQPKVVAINGDNNVGVAGNHNNVNINVRGAPRKAVQINVQPGEQHISDEQAAEVRDLVAKVVSASGQGFPFVWGTLKKRFRFSKYQLLDREKYEAVRAYLRKWVASATVKSDESIEDQRKRLLKRIHAEARKRRGTLDQIRSYVSGRFGTNSLAELTPGQLQEVIKEFGL